MCPGDDHLEKEVLTEGRTEKGQRGLEEPRGVRTRGMEAEMSEGRIIWSPCHGEEVETKFPF